MTDTEDLRACAHVLARYGGCNPVEPLAPQLEAEFQRLDKELERLDGLITRANTVLEPYIELINRVEEQNERQRIANAIVDCSPGPARV